jgi:uncharacterized protein (AIM24 family)
VQSTLGAFQETESTDAFSLQNHKLLKVSLNQVTVQAKLGAMVAYQGEVRFEHAGSGGLNRMMKKALTGESIKLMKIDGSGEVFLANHAEDIHLIKLENDAITCNGPNVLAFDAGIDWDINRIQGAGMMAGGLFNVTLTGTGWVAVVSDGPPVLLKTGEVETFCDPQAAIAWPAGLATHVKADVNLKTFVGRGSGEGIQLGFVGAGWVLVQPSEGHIKQEVGDGGGSSGGGIGGMLGGLTG